MKILIVRFSLLLEVIGSPRLGEVQQTYAQIVIAANDNTNGVLQLSADRVTIEEDHTGAIVSVVRSAGDFGQVHESKLLYFVRFQQQESS